MAENKLLHAGIDKNIIRTYITNHEDAFDGELYTYLPGILLSYGAFLMAIASPGPNVLAVIGTSMAVNCASGLALAMGVAAGTLTWALLTAIGLSTLLATYASALLFIKIFGGLYLLWLAYKAFRCICP